MLDINNREDIFERLSVLRPEDPAQFGKMSPQHMVEHLIFTLRMSDGKLPHILYYRPEKAAKIKAYTIYSDREFMVGFRAPMLGDEPPPLKERDLAQAIETLRQELADFDEFFSENPLATPTNPTMGPLDFREWIVFHNKHFTHHFKQFNLVAPG